ncbi:enoyl-CoA hydratase/isomerase family protein [Aquabacterium sp.]|uniref:enoyl-CoA hydratase/isomerase family protein n=1 Tax=Aquabacterium sp. TaxID=1872578 RepID=UPI002C7D61B8|nr:enoyl-CoA hydratase/isomerase family protein [Aquabacterium sp.]HSW07470.1 enoyl-CoA hydratase/isomerase family protein [Aquabacterium sp.]
MTEPVLLRELQAGVLTLSLNRPAKLNAINGALASALLAELQAADATADVRAVLIRGNGRAFCAGRDVSEAPTDDDLTGVQAVAQAIVHCSKPVLAAVQGWVVGAGLEWMLDADIVIAARGARFKLPEASLGVFVTGGITATLPALAGLARAKALMLLGDAFTAEQAQAWGLVWALVDDEQLDVQAQQAAARLAALPAGIAGRFKQVLNEIGLPAFEQALQRETAMQLALMGKPAG